MEIIYDGYVIRNMMLWSTSIAENHGGQDWIDLGFGPMRPLDILKEVRERTNLGLRLYTAYLTNVYDEAHAPYSGTF